METGHLYICFWKLESIIFELECMIYFSFFMVLFGM